MTYLIRISSGNAAYLFSYIVLEIYREFVKRSVLMFDFTTKFKCVDIGYQGFLANLECQQMTVGIYRIRTTVTHFTIAPEPYGHKF